MTNTGTINLHEVQNRAAKSHKLADWLTAQGATAEAVATDSELRDRAAEATACVGHRVPSEVTWAQVVGVLAYRESLAALPDSETPAEIATRLADELLRALGDAAHYSTEDDEPDPSTLEWMQYQTGSDYRIGSETEPGVWHDGDEYLTWDWDPTSRGDVIQVTESDLYTERRAWAVGS